MDITTFKNRLEDLENGIKELRLDFKLDWTSGFKLEELRNELETIKQDEEYFYKMKITAIVERDKLHSIELDIIKKAQIDFNEENYENLKEDPIYCKIIKDLNICHQKYGIGERYYLRLQKERKKILEKIHKMESRIEVFK